VPCAAVPDYPDMSKYTLKVAGLKEGGYLLKIDGVPAPR